MFDTGIYDLGIPINFDTSLRRAWTTLAPAATDRVLDIGCGSGRMLLHVLPWLRSGGHLTGLDVDPGGLAYAGRRAQQLGVADQVTFVQGNMSDLDPDQIGAFDGAVAHFSVYTLPSDAERRAAIHQVARVLRPRARFVLVVPNECYRARPLVADARRAEGDRKDIPLWLRLVRQWALCSFTEWGTRRNVEKKLDQDIYHRYTAPELVDHLTSAGFRDIHITRTPGLNSYCAWGCLGEPA
jgi:ubiquinone/menaquinone biosynthesis C-methylase UbiE